VIRAGLRIITTNFADTERAEHPDYQRAARPNQQDEAPPRWIARQASENFQKLSPAMHILLPEDHQSTLPVLERTLRGWGHEVAAADDLFSALGVLGTTRFEAIISDIALPDNSGYALMSQARRTGSEGVAIAMSAYPFPPDAY
jgi:PleD family two-component response regulator